MKAEEMPKFKINLFKEDYKDVGITIVKHGRRKFQYSLSIESSQSVEYYKSQKRL